MKFIKGMNQFLRNVCTTLLILMTCLVIFQVVSRKFLGISIAQVEEIARYCMIWVGLLGAGICVISKAHIAVEVVRDQFPPKIKKIATMVSYILMFLFFSILIYYGSDLVNSSMMQFSPSMPWLKMGYVMSVVPLMGIIGNINIVYLIIDEFIVKKEKSE